MIDLRPARMSDTERLFAWRNDPETQACFRSTAPVSREEHDRWMQYNVQQGYPQHVVMIADSEWGSVGVVRFDAERGDVMVYEASITVAPEHRGKKLAHGILDLACRYMNDCTITAEIRKTNAASRRIFERCGFDDIGTKDGFIQYRKGPE